MNMCTNPKASKQVGQKLVKRVVGLVYDIPTVIGVPEQHRNRHWFNLVKLQNARAGVSQF